MYVIVKSSPVQVKYEGIDSARDLQLIKAVCSSVADLQTLGINYCPGSMAMIAITGFPIYMLSPQGTWVPKEAANGQ